MADSIPAEPISVTRYTLRAQGDRCLSIDFGHEISVQTGLICLAAAQALRAAALTGVTDIVPSYTSVALHYHPTAGADSANINNLSHAIERLIARGLPALSATSRLVEIPVCYGAEHGPDLAEVALKTGLTQDQVIELHTAPGSMVFMLGFAPGSPYIGLHDAAFALPRREVPRTAVPKGSVAIANRQTAIYPNRLPGGWHILGATPLNMFEMGRTPPALLMPGDRVRFVPISTAEFDRIIALQGGPTT